MKESGEALLQQNKKEQFTSEVSLDTTQTSVIPENPDELQERMFDLRDEIEQRTNALKNAPHQQEYYGDTFSTDINGTKTSAGLIMSQKRKLEQLQHTYQAMTKVEHAKQLGVVRGFMKKVAMVAGFVGSMFAAKEAVKKETAETQLASRTEISTK